jgi:nucleoside-diphosphate-sugar epimerase
VTGALNILVTGAAGFIGAEVAARLAQDGHNVIGLVHQRGQLARNNGRRVRSAAYDPGAGPGTGAVPGVVRIVTGDVTADGLGLDDRARAGLSGRLDRVVHCASATGFGLPAATYQSVNVDGTTRVAEFARDGGIPLVHVGTAYVCGERDGVATEDQLDVGQRFGSHYEESKLRAEQAVLKASAHGLPVAIVRPSIVSGAERTGAIRDFRHMYVVLRLITEGRVRSLPGYYDAILDLVPVDYAAGLIAEAAVRFEEVAGQTLHAVGPQLRLRDVSDVLAEYPAFQVARFVSPSAFRADQLPDAERAYYDRVASLYDTYFRRRIRFDDTAAARFSSRRRVTSGAPYLRRLIDYAVKAGYLAAQVPAAGQARASSRRRSDR